MNEGRTSTTPEAPSLPMRQFDCRGGRYLRVDRHGRLWRVAYYEPRPRANEGLVDVRFACADEDLGFAVARVLAEADSPLFPEPIARYVRNVMAGEL